MQPGAGALAPGSRLGSLQGGRWEVFGGVATVSMATRFSVVWIGCTVFTSYVTRQTLRSLNFGVQEDWLHEQHV